LYAGITSSGTKAYVVAHNLIRAHAMVYRSYDSIYRMYQHGRLNTSILFCVI